MGYSFDNMATYINEMRDAAIESTMHLLGIGGTVDGGFDGGNPPVRVSPLGGHYEGSTMVQGGQVTDPTGQYVATIPIGPEWPFHDLPSMVAYYNNAITELFQDWWQSPRPEGFEGADRPVRPGCPAARVRRPAQPRHGHRVAVRRERQPQPDLDHPDPDRALRRAGDAGVRGQLRQPAPDRRRRPGRRRVLPLARCGGRAGDLEPHPAGARGHRGPGPRGDEGVRRRWWRRVDRAQHRRRPRVGPRPGARTRHTGSASGSSSTSTALGMAAKFAPAAPKTVPARCGQPDRA